MPSENFIKNIISKDKNIQTQTLKTMINSGNIEYFEELCEKSEFIFPYLKERINRDFVKLIEEKNLDIIFKFSKIYNLDFEDMIVNSLTKFACEDLTDEILELFNTGTKEQKAYCAKYFSKINDPLAIEYLNKYALDDFEPLRVNCAQALKKFSDTEILELAKKTILQSNDEFEKLKMYSFICSYSGEKEIKFVVKNALNSPFSSNIIADVLDNNDINYLKNILDEEEIIRIYEKIIEEYPEDISLDSVMYWNILEFSKILYNFQNQFAKNALLLAKLKFNEFNKNDIYTYDLDKNTKEELKNISTYLNSINLDEKNVIEELNNINIDYRFNLALDVIKEYKLNYCSDKITNLVNSDKLTYKKLANCASTLKTLGKIDSINPQIIEDIKDANIKALIKSYI